MAFAVLLGMLGTQPSVAQTARGGRVTLDFATGWRSGTPVTITGEVTVFYADDFEKRQSTIDHGIRDDRTGQMFRLRFEHDAPLTVRSGTKLTVTGHAVGSEVYVAGCCDAASGTTSSSNMQILSTPSSAPQGDQRTLVIVGNFRDATVQCSNDAMRNLMFAPPTGIFDGSGTGLSVNAQYQDSSRGQVSFSGAVVGPYAIDALSVDTCDLNKWITQANGQAAASGTDVSSYAHLVYVFPEQNTCPGAGLSTVGGTPSVTEVFSCGTSGVWSHELGHAIGMDHAGALDPTGVITEFGDASDPMSWSTWQMKGFNAPHRQQMGWLDTNHTALVNRDGQYAVSALSTDPALVAGPQVIMIPKPDTSDYYLLSYRIAQGFDNYISGVFKGSLSIHRSYTPTGSNRFTYLVSYLGDGETFTDQKSGITVSLMSHNSNFATAQVRFTCIPTAPDLTVAPQAQSGTSGTRLNYTISVTNKDPDICPLRTFTLNGAIPPGWANSFSTGTVSLGPGQTAPVTFSVTSSPTSSAGTYNATVTAADSNPATSIAASGTIAVSSTAVYTVLAPTDVVPPSAPSGLSATYDKRLKQVQLSWNAATDNLGVSGYSIVRNGVTVAISNVTTWNDQAVDAGVTYTYYVVAYDAAGNMSARSNNATATAPGGGGGKKK